MDTEKLCSIHSAMGAQALSPTCSSFPRTNRVYKNEIEKSLNLSCPEVTRLLLNDRESMSMMESVIVQQFDTVEVSFACNTIDLSQTRFNFILQG